MDHDEHDHDDEGECVAPVSSAAPSADLVKAVDRPGANTGVKGVLADFADASHKLSLLERAQNEEAWRQLDSHALVARTVREQEDHERKMREAADAKRDHKDEEDELSADEDEFMAQYRLKRLEQLKVEQAAAIKASYRPTFGSLLSFTADQLTESLDHVEHPDTCVIVHLMEPHLQECAMLNAVLSNLARKMVHNKFIKVSASDAEVASLSEDVLPTLVVFRNGEQIHTWVRFLDQIGGVLNEETVTAWLLKEGVLILDDEQREKLMTMHESRIEKFKRAQLIDPDLMRKLTEILK